MTTSITKPPTRQKAMLRDKGWSLRAAAPHLGVSHIHLHYVLNGVRQSRRLLSAVEALPNRDKTAAHKLPKTNPSTIPH